MSGRGRAVRLTAVVSVVLYPDRADRYGLDQGQGAHWSWGTFSQVVRRIRERWGDRPFEIHAGGG